MPKLTGTVPTLFAFFLIGAVPAQNHHPRGGGHDHSGHAHGMPAPGTRPTIGGVIPPFTLADHAGVPVQLEAARRPGEGRITVLTFWCTTCMSCRLVEREFDERAERYAARNVVSFMVDSNHTDDTARVGRFLQGKDLGFKVLMDSQSQVARHFGATQTTTTVVVDGAGRLRYWGSFAEADAAVSNLLAGEEVAVPETSTSG